MKAGTIKIKVDLFRNAFIVGACATDGSSLSLSTKDWIREEISNTSYEDLFSVINEKGTYKVIRNHGDYPNFVLLKEEG